MATGISR